MTVSILGVALMFVSGIIVPLEAIPPWEQLIARCMPLYYAADAFKEYFWILLLVMDKTFLFCLLGVFRDF